MAQQSAAQDSSSTKSIQHKVSVDSAAANLPLLFVPVVSVAVAMRASTPRALCLPLSLLNPGTSHCLNC